MLPFYHFALQVCSSTQESRHLLLIFVRVELFFTRAKYFFWPWVKIDRPSFQRPTTHGVEGEKLQECWWELQVAGGKSKWEGLAVLQVLVGTVFENCRLWWQRRGQRPALHSAQLKHSFLSAAELHLWLRLPHRSSAKRHLSCPIVFVRTKTFGNSETFFIFTWNLSAGCSQYSQQERNLLIYKFNLKIKIKRFLKYDNLT